MRIVVLVDAEQYDPNDPDFLLRSPQKYYEADFHVCEALRNLGHKVIGIPACTDIEDTVARIKAARPNVVFNLVEQIAGSRRMDSLVVGVLELLNIPYTGAAFEALMVSRNKHLSKLIVSQAGVDVPRSFELRNEESVSNKIRFPIIVKPLYTDGSEGIASRSVVRSALALRQRVALITKRFNQPAVCEEFVEGRELYVTLSGGTKVSIDSICELVFPSNSNVAFATERVKFDEEYRKRNEIYYKTPTVLGSALAKRVCTAACHAYRALRINSYAKLEFRLRGDEPVFLEANPNSHLSRFSSSTDFQGIGYERFIRRIIKLALVRR